MPERLLVAGGTVSTPRGWIDADVLVEEGRVVRLAPAIRAGRGAVVVSAKAAKVLPGLIDLQINGAFGRSFASAPASEIADVARGLAGFGVTGFLAALVSMPMARAVEALSRLREAAEGNRGARILGVHLEGPFLNPDRRGAHEAGHIRKPSLAEFTRLVGAAGGLAKMMTIAPEMKGAVSLIAAGARRGMTMSIGHSAAGRDSVNDAIQAGATAVTHLFNSMAPFHHREEGLVAAALVDDRLTCTVIYDRHHVSRSAMEMAIRCKPAGRLALVSDAVAALGVPDGVVEVDGRKVEVKGGEVKLKGTETLAGSAVSILQGVRNVVEDGLLPLEKAWELASSVPARLVGLDKTAGEIAPDRDADLVVLEEGWKVRATIAQGRWIHGNHRQG